MESRRKFLGYLPAGLAGVSCLSRMEAQGLTTSGTSTLTITPARSSHRPLEEILVSGAGEGRLLVLDGDGKPYVDRAVTLPASFLVGGALGSQLVLFLDQNQRLQGRTGFHVDEHTEIREPSGEYGHLLDTLYWTMASDGPIGARRHNGKVYTYWVDWLLDNTNTLKGMRYFWPEVKKSFDIFSDTQREDGMIWENYLDRTPPQSDWDRRFKYGDFSRSADDGFLSLRRAPVENHVEMYFLEALYLAWKTTGDDTWMQKHLDHAMRAVHYATTDPYRWSKKYKLLKRGLTIDTWDFLCDSEAALVHGDIMVVDLEKTHFGIFFGDNTGMIAGCRYLAEMLDHAERTAESASMRTLADQLEERLNRVSWNGRFYSHWVAEDEDFHPDLGVDMAKQVSLSNSYSLNRGIESARALAIIDTYQSIRNEMPPSSPGEFYSIYPPFTKGFGSEQRVWDYVNGGVLACTAGELARGCFQHGRPRYGVDILKRVHDITRRHRDFLPGILRGMQIQRPPTDFTPLDLSSRANCDTGEGGDGVPGWVGQANNNLINFPSGSQTFRGVPFKIASGKENGHRVCIGVASHPPFSAATLVPVHRPCRSFYLLHACAGSSASFGKLTIHYKDGSKQVEYIERGVSGNSYWAPEDLEFNNRYGTNTAERMQVAWRGKSGMIDNVGVWITSFEPTSRDEAIDSLELESLENGSHWFVIGITLSSMPPFLPPWSDVSTGMPNNWGAGCVTAALIEGLGGIEDLGGGYRSARITPNWLAADTREAEVSARYPASQGYVHYRYRERENSISLDFTSCADLVTVRIPLPNSRQLKSVKLDERKMTASTEHAGDTEYATLEAAGRGVHRVEIWLT